MKLENQLVFQLFISIKLVTVVEITTTYSLLGVDILLSLFFFLRLVRNKQSIIGLNPSCNEAESLETEKDKMLEEFVLAKAGEFLAPIVFLLQYILAFYGPNYDIMGSIGNTYFYPKKTEDISGVIKVELLVFLTILSNMAFSCIIVWVICRRNLYQLYCNCMKTFGYILMFELIKGSNMVS